MRSRVSARSHDFKIRREGGFRSASARTTCHARWPASVTPYRPASLFARSPSYWSFWRWKESLDDESTKFFLRIDTGDVRFDRGVELIELVRCEGDRWTALFFDSEDAGRAGRRIRARPYDRQQGTSGNRAREYSDDRTVGGRSPQQGPRVLFLLHRQDGPSERVDFVRLFRQSRC